ncbi:MAG TPA: MBOAT family O-acyltransferase [Anaerolineales bacterium]|nr:MBOAT family O-acyltransferase [Anaerolineales bacterium]
MNLTQIFIFVALGLSAGRLYKLVSRGWLLFVASVLAVFWLQPASLIRNLPFVLPVASLGLATAVWALTLPREVKVNRQDWSAAGALAGLALLVSAARFVEPLSALFAARPPALVFAAISVSGILLLGSVCWLLRGQKFAIHIAALLIIAILVVLKWPAQAQAASGFLRSMAGQDPALAGPLDIGWLGFSYIAFRLIHVLRDRTAGRLPAISLRDFVTYIVFFPTLTSGPIDRVDRFTPQMHGESLLGNDQFLAAGRRLVTGLFMKFILADALAYFALNPTNAWQVQSSGWMWIILAAYSFRIFFDFAGYTHIAIGLGMLFGVVLPENFNRPYLKQNITAFWNSWHMTLTQWVRSYYFNPVTRWLREHNVSTFAVILLGQLSTMMLIGLWHGITWNFVTWGLWHGAGLFIHNQWTSFARTRNLQSSSPRLLVHLSMLFTFTFVTISWVWFALPQPVDVARVVRMLLGGN